MPVQRLEQGAGGMTELVLEIEGRTLVVGDDAGVIRVWRLGDRPAILRDIEPRFTNIDALVWLADHSGIVAAGRDGIGAWSLDGGEVGAWPVLDGAPQSLAVVNERHVLVGCDDSRLRLVDFSAGRVLGEVAAGERNTGIAPHPDGRRFAVSACDQGGSQIQWVAVEGESLRALDQPRVERGCDHLSAPAIDARGELLMVADHRLGLFDIATSERVAGFNADGKVTRLRLGDGLLVARPWTQAVRLGERALACASPDGPVCVYDVGTRSLTRLDDLTRPATALAADGPVLAAASLDWTIVIWWP